MIDKLINHAVKLEQVALRKELDADMAYIAAYQSDAPANRREALLAKSTAARQEREEVQTALRALIHQRF